ncbi:hypothetical protein MVEN_00263800 [Mycena venus]|uniref:DUF6535 domain-containing protein n=1 Tax=Mycena venus TaxID=2733690 RepID=A0A8H6Z2A5_9AGAR|nr:hypothetical protein MVEN_00263800 [Mycena venus]
MSPSPTEAPTAGDAPDLGEPVPLEATQAPENEKNGEVTHESPGQNVNGVLGTLIEQSASLKTIVESLTKAVEALKQQPQSPDKRIAFWTAYKKLADEFDDELQRKYGQDLDTSLIFAGLFSAVSSAFIIQIQPELQPDPNTATQALLAVLVQNITGSSATQFSPEASISQTTTASTTVVIAQSLLYFSLFSTLLAALLAVLAKQWLLHYNSVGERGTIAERGIERQRKFDGMRRWQFDLVMQVFPLLLQFALLLFAAALSIYLPTIHRALAAIALSLTALGALLYTVMVISAVASPDSPFQTSLSFLLKNILHHLPIPGRWQRFIKGTWEGLHRALGQVCTVFSKFWTTCTGVIMPLLPLFHISKPSDPVPIFDVHVRISEDVSAVVWALETSTDPGVVEIAAELVPELQWPLNLEVRPAQKRLDDTFRSCIKGSWTVPDGMANRATACIRAFWFLDMVTKETQRPPWLWTHCNSALEDESIFADFLFCLNSFFSQTMPQDCAVLNKSRYTTRLITLLFKNLVRRLTDSNPLNTEIAANIVIKAAKIADSMSLELVDADGIKAVYCFCALPGVSQEAIISTLRLVRLEIYILGNHNWGVEILPMAYDTTWLHRTVESVCTMTSDSDVNFIRDLWQALFILRHFHRMTLKTYHILLVVS